MSKKLRGLILGMLALQLAIPTFNGSEVSNGNFKLTDGNITYPLITKINKALPTDLVNIPDANLKQAIATELGVDVNGITIDDMSRLTRANCPGCGITDISGLEYATNLQYVDLSNNQISDISKLTDATKITFLDLSENQISDISPISNFSVLGDLDLSVNKISDITPLSGLLKLKFLDLSTNQIEDISPLKPLKTDGVLNFVTASTQTINLSSITVYTKDEIFHNIVDINGVDNPISLGIPNQGVNNLTNNFNVYDDTTKVRLTGTINQEVTFRSITGLDAASSAEEQTLTDEQLIALFNVESIEGQIITVDQSTVDYSAPGEYQVTFTEGDNIDQITSTLTITDTKPIITSTNEQVTIEVGDKINSLIAIFGVTASEITVDDLTSKITVDDSAVNYNTPGTYNIVFSVVDQEGNVESVTCQLLINAKPEEPVVDPDSDTGSEVDSETTSEVDSETNSEVDSETTSEVDSDTSSEVEVETSLETTSEVDSATSSEVKQFTVNKIAKTGGKIIIILSILAIVLVIIVLVKRMVNKDEEN